MNDIDPASPPAPAPEPPPDSAAAAADVKPKRKSPEKPAKRKGFYGFALDWFEQFGQHLPKHLHEMAMWLGGRWWFHDQPKRLLLLAFRGDDEPAVRPDVTEQPAREPTIVHPAEYVLVGVRHGGKG